VYFRDWFQPTNDQADTDQDLAGDACDADDDKDGIEDALDVAPLNRTLVLPRWILTWMAK